jgi:hypothetical protein
MTTPPEPDGRAAPGHTSHGYPRFLSCRRLETAMAPWPPACPVAISRRAALFASGDRSAALIQLAGSRALVLPRVAWQCAATRDLAALLRPNRSRRTQGRSMIIALLYDAPTERRATTRSPR